MILLLGGTFETAALALALAGAGERVLVSTATQAPLKIGSHERISRRCGRLDAAAMEHLLRSEGIRLLIDATHPYAVEVHATAKKAADRAEIPCLTYVRPGAADKAEEALVVASHEEAARLAVSFQRPILLTAGSRNIGIYAQEAARTGAILIARVLDCEDSVAACRKAGVPAEHIVTGRGPFGVEENRALIRRFAVGVLVTKDSGEAGGFPAKAEAARLESGRLVVVGRPELKTDLVFHDLADLVTTCLTT
jgi:precorrin-6A/cobalt-precorrin-6A reductase